MLKYAPVAFVSILTCRGPQKYSPALGFGFGGLQLEPDRSCGLGFDLGCSWVVLTRSGHPAKHFLFQKHAPNTFLVFCGLSWRIILTLVDELN